MDEIHYKVMCLMSVGAPLTDQVCQVLLLNAIDMWEEHRHAQLIKSHQYDGKIESDLEVIKYFDVPVVIFKALVSTQERFRATEVRYCIRVDDLDNMNPAEWERIMDMGGSSLPHLPLNEDPPAEWN
jgi:hypothetical protein